MDAQPTELQREPRRVLDTRIARAEIRKLLVPTGMKSFVLPNGHRTPTHLPVLLIRLVDEDDVIGYSMLWVQREQQIALFEATLRYLADTVEGHRLDETPTIPVALQQATGFIGGEGVAAFGVSGFEMALEDLTCRRAGLSLSRSLGRVRDTVPAYQTGLMLNASIDELVVETAKIVASGIKAIKMIVGRPTLEEDVDRIRAVKEALPSDGTLMVDALQRWDRRSALRAAELFAEFDLAWLEDPIHHADLAGYRLLAERAPVPVATGESLFALADLAALVDAKVPYVIAELERVGGIRPWMRIADVVEAGSAAMLPHIYPHISAQLTAALTQRDVWWEYVPWFDDIVNEPFTVVDGVVTVPDTPGSGFNPDLDAVERLAQGPWRSLTDQ